MADTEKNEDQKISRCLQEAFGYTDEQLLKQLDQANETLKDVTFDGAEDRIMKKIMARKAELEKETSAPEPETERNITLVKADPEERKDKKIVRFGKKKVLATVALVAVIAGMLGGTAVGKKNYFFRKKQSTEINAVINNDNNKKEDSTLDEAYKEIKRKLNCQILKLVYVPSGMQFQEYTIYTNEAELKFLYEDNIINLFQIKNEEIASVDFKIDHQIKHTVYNKWIGKDIEYTVNYLGTKEEYGAILTEKNVTYHIIGCMSQNEFEKILKNLNYY